MSLQKIGWKRPYSPIILILLLGFGLRLLGLDGQSLWWDELKTWERATMPLNEMVSNLIGIRDQVPLYYWLMRFWAQLGTEAAILRLFSVFFGLLSVALVYKIGRLLAGQVAGTLGAFLLAISPFHIWYSQEVRMYAWLVSLLLLAHLLLLRLLRQNRVRWWLAYGLLMTAALYTHYFTFLILLVHYVFFVLHRQQFKRQTAGWFVTMAGVGAAFAPWVWLVLTRTDGYSTAVPDWLTLIQWRDLPLTLRLFATGFGLGGQWPGAANGLLFILGAAAAVPFIRLKNGGGGQRPFPHQTLHVRLLFLWFTLPLAITFLVSLDNPLGQTGSFSLYNDRYLLIILPPFLLLAALGWQRFRRLQIAFWLGLLLITGITAVSLAQQISNPRFARNDWRTAVAQIEAIGSGPHLIIGHKDVLLPVSYYGNGRLQFIQIPPPETEEITPAFSEAMESQMQLAAEQNSLVWHAELFYNLNPHGFPDERNALVASEADTLTGRWLAARYARVDVQRLPGIRITLYDISATSP